MFKISATVNTNNEEHNIADCLKSLQWVDELIVVDSGSTDKTIEIARLYAHRVISIEGKTFAENCNAGLEQLRGEWVLVVHADERVSPELRSEIQSKIASNPSETSFYIPHKNLFKGHWVKYGGWYPDYVLRLFRNSPEHRYSGLLHEKLSIQGSIGHLKHPFIHFAYSGLEQYLTKFNRYTTSAAETIGVQKRKVTLFHLIMRPIFEFIKMFIVKRGFMDGVYGLIVAYMSSMYIFVKFAKAWLKQQEAGE